VGIPGMGKLPGGGWDRIFVLMRRMGVSSGILERLRAEPARRMSEAYFSLGVRASLRVGDPAFLLVAGSDGLMWTWQKNIGMTALPLARP
jgi:hypothetical protein